MIESRHSYCKESRVQFFWPTLYMYAATAAVTWPMATTRVKIIAQHYILLFTAFNRELLNFGPSRSMVTLE